MTDFMWVTRPKRLVSYLIDDVIVKAYSKNIYIIIPYGSETTNDLRPTVKISTVGRKMSI